MGSTLVKKGNLTQKFFLSFIGDRRSVRLQAVTLVPLTRPPTPNVEAGSHLPSLLSSTCVSISFVYLLRNIDIDFSCCYLSPSDSHLPLKLINFQAHYGGWSTRWACAGGRSHRGWGSFIKLETKRCCVKCSLHRQWRRRCFHLRAWISPDSPWKLTSLKAIAQKRALGWLLIFWF